MAVHESLKQRIVVSYHFAGFAREEVPAYLMHRLQLAGCTLPLFEPPAIEALSHACQGLPRKLNRAAHYALSVAPLAKARQVSAEHVQSAIPLSCSHAGISPRHSACTCERTKHRQRRKPSSICSDRSSHS